MQRALSPTLLHRCAGAAQASRERKTQEAQERCEREEAARLEADRAEAAERAAARQLAIQRANKMLHDEGDRVKALHGRLLLSEVIAQNRALAEHKGRVTAARRAQDAAFVKRQQEALEVSAARSHRWLVTTASATILSRALNPYNQS